MCWVLDGQQVELWGLGLDGVLGSLGVNAGSLGV